MATQIAYALAATVVAAAFCITPAEAALVLRQSGAVATVGSETAPGSNVYDVVL